WTTLYAERDGVLLTPPLSAGVLPGVHRAFMIEEGERIVRQETLTVDDLIGADRLFAGNAVRGLIPARMISDPE
ncbi:MAG: aminotransferase class IV, partial [Pseudomonadota bacterium]